TVPPYYDSLIAKLISHGSTREQAMVRMQIALDELLIDGIKSNIPLHRELVRDAGFKKGGVNIHYLEARLGL
ncbi:MAG: acetyl-CoA carboxylase biotin carboxylase subunit, partial [Pseudohongiellaceae bacterium]